MECCARFEARIVAHHGGTRAGEQRQERGSRDGEAAIDLILRQETPRGKELVLLEMQPALVEEQTPSKLSPSLFCFS